MILDTWLLHRDHRARDIEHKGSARAQQTQCGESGEQDLECEGELKSWGALYLAPSNDYADFCVKPVALIVENEIKATKKSCDAAVSPRVRGSETTQSHEASELLRYTSKTNNSPSQH